MGARNPTPGAARLRVQTVHPDNIPTLVVRVPQASTTADPGTTPYFPDPSTVSVPPSNNKTGGLAKSVLEYLFLSAALILLVSMVLRRVLQLRKANQSFTAFFNTDNDHSLPSRGPRNFPRTTGMPNVPFTGPYPDPHLTGFPPVYLGHSGRRTRATDTDQEGRRLADRAAELDHGGMLGDKDILPAYDSFGGPPKYVDLELQIRLFPMGNTTDRPVEAPATRLPGEANLGDSADPERQDASREAISYPPPPSSPSTRDMARDAI